MNNNLSIKNIDFYYDLFDEAIMLLYDKLGIDYLRGFLRVYNDISLNQINTHLLEDEDIIKLEEIENKIIEASILNEEVRKALLLIIIKAFKHCKMNLDIITPDFICYIFANFIKMISEDRSNDVFSVLDVNVGTANLLNLISNNLDQDYLLTGVEKEEDLIRIAEAYSDLQGNDIRLCFNNCLDNIDLRADVIIGDLDCSYQEDKYLPYEIIIKYQNAFLKEGRNDNFMIFMVDNDFFNQKGIDQFKEKFKGTICGLIVLPSELFQSKGKSILVINQKYFDKFDTMLINWPKPSEEDKLYDIIIKLHDWIKNIKKYKEKKK